MLLTVGRQAVVGVTRAVTNRLIDAARFGTGVIGKLIYAGLSVSLLTAQVVLTLQLTVGLVYGFHFLDPRHLAWIVDRYQQSSVPWDFTIVVLIAVVVWLCGIVYVLVALTSAKLWEKLVREVRTLAKGTAGLALFVVSLCAVVVLVFYGVLYGVVVRLLGHNGWTEWLAPPAARGDGLAVRLAGPAAAAPAPRAVEVQAPPPVAAHGVAVAPSAGVAVQPVEEAGPAGAGNAAVAGAGVVPAEAQMAPAGAIAGSIAVSACYGSADAFLAALGELTSEWEQRPDSEVMVACRDVQRVEAGRQVAMKLSGFASRREVQIAGSYEDLEQLVVDLHASVCRDAADDVGPDLGIEDVLARKAVAFATPLAALIEAHERFGSVGPGDTWPLFMIVSSGLPRDSFPLDMIRMLCAGNRFREMQWRVEDIEMRLLERVVARTVDSLRDSVSALGEQLAQCQVVGAGGGPVPAAADGHGGVVPSWPEADLQVVEAVRTAVGEAGQVTVGEPIDPAIRYRPLMRVDAGGQVILVFSADLQGRSWVLEERDGAMLLVPVDGTGATHPVVWPAYALTQALPLLRACPSLQELDERLKIAVLVNGGFIAGVEPGWSAGGAVWVGTVVAAGVVAVEGFEPFDLAAFLAGGEALPEAEPLAE